MRSKHHLTGLRSMSPLLIGAFVMLLLSSCGKKSRVSLPHPVRQGETQTGIASWYGDPYHGRRAANGEVYDMFMFTAAHRTWPFDTFVRVTNLTNNKEVDVRITDRGPFVDDRIIDLSRAAAEKIDMIGPGIVKVKLRVLNPSEADPSTLPAGSFAVQAASFRDRDRAEQLCASLEKKFGSARITMSEGSSLWRVLIGRESTRARAQQLAERVRREVPDAIVVRE
jgi:rare lipoprotein A